MNDGLTVLARANWKLENMRASHCLLVCLTNFYCGCSENFVGMIKRRVWWQVWRCLSVRSPSGQTDTNFNILIKINWGRGYISTFFVSLSFWPADDFSKIPWVCTLQVSQYEITIFRSCEYYVLWLPNSVYKNHLCIPLFLRFWLTHAWENLLEFLHVQLCFAWPAFCITLILQFSLRRNRFPSRAKNQENWIFKKYWNARK